MTKYIEVTMIYDDDSKTWGQWSKEPEWFLDRVKESITGFTPQPDVVMVVIKDTEDADADL